MGGLRLEHIEKFQTGGNQLRIALAAENPVQPVFYFPAHQTLFKQKILCSLRGNQIIFLHMFLLIHFTVLT